MTGITHELLAALEADQSCELDEIIARRRPEDLEALRGLLRPDPSINPLHRARAVYAVGRWGDPAVVDELRALLPELDHAGRIGAIDALGRLGTDDALDAVLAYSDDTSLPVRKFVTKALGRIATPRAHAELRDLASNDPSDYIRSLAAGRLT